MIPIYAGDHLEHPQGPHFENHWTKKPRISDMVLWINRVVVKRKKNSNFKDIINYVSDNPSQSNHETLVLPDEGWITKHSI